jgi:hypothetical protein
MYVFTQSLHRNQTGTSKDYADLHEAACYFTHYCEGKTESSML